MSKRVQVGPFELVRRTSIDALGEVWVATVAGEPARPVVARRLPEWILRDPARLASVAARVRDLTAARHPVLVPVRELAVGSGDGAVIEDHNEGVGLDAVIAWCSARGRSIPVPVTLHVITQVCNGLDTLHALAGSGTSAESTLHLAIRPSAIRIGRDGAVYLGGYGLVRSPVVAPRPSGQVNVADVAYLSPEQTTSDQPLGPMSDLFSLGATLYELLTLERVFDGQSPLQTIHKVRRAEVSAQLAKAREVVPGIDKVLYRALSLNPRHRYQRAFVLREDLRGLMSGWSFNRILDDIGALASEVLNANALTGTLHLPTPAPLPPTSTLFDTEEDEDEGDLPATTQARHGDTAPFDRVAPAGGNQPQYGNLAVVGRGADAMDMTGTEPPLPEHTEWTHRPSEGSDVTDPTAAQDRHLPRQAGVAARGVLPEPPPPPMHGATPAPPEPPRERPAPPARTPSAAKAASSPPPAPRPAPAAAAAPAPAEEDEIPQRPKGLFGLAAAGGALTAVLAISCAGIGAVGAALLLSGGSPDPVVVSAPGTPAEEAPPAAPPPAVAPPPEAAPPAPVPPPPAPEPAPAPPQVAKAAPPAPPPAAKAATPPAPPPVAKASPPPAPAVAKAPPPAPASRPAPAPVARPAPAPAPVAVAKVTPPPPVVSVPLPEPPAPAAPTDLATHREAAGQGRLSAATRSELEAVPVYDPTFEQARTYLYEDAKARGDLAARKRHLDALFELSENTYDPALLAERGALDIARGDYESALANASLAERYWARLPSDLVFSRKAMIHETQAAAWQAIFYRSAGDDADALNQAIRAWERYQQHVAAGSRSDLVKRADAQLASLGDVQARLQ